MLERNKIVRLVFFLDDAWFILSTYVTAKIKHDGTKDVRYFVKFHVHHSQVDLEREYHGVRVSRKNKFRPSHKINPDTTIR